MQVQWTSATAAAIFTPTAKEQRALQMLVEGSDRKALDLLDQIVAGNPERRQPIQLMIMTDFPVYAGVTSTELV